MFSFAVSTRIAQIGDDGLDDRLKPPSSASQMLPLL
jgi:hypothetical protein